MIERHPNCDKCGLFQTCKTPWMDASGASDPVIMVVGEAPGEDEDKRGVPFVGRSGKLLREALEGLEINLNDVCFTNTVRCRPPENVTKKQHINYCKHYVEEEIAAKKPAIVLLMGNSPLNAILGESGVSNWNGVVVQRDGISYIPMYHPAYILRNMNELNGWLSTMDTAIRSVIDGTAAEATVNYHYPNTVSEVIKWLEYLSMYEQISYDVETNGLDPFSEGNAIIAVGLSAGDVAISFLIDHKDATWKPWQRDKIIYELATLLTDPTKMIIGHNVKFDQKHTRRLLDIDFKPGGDTMLVSALLDSRPGIHRLKKLAGLHLGMYDYDKPLDDYKKANKDCDPKRGGVYGNIPPNILLPYTAKDAFATISLHHKLYPKLSDKQQILYKELLMAISDTLSRVEYQGNNIDPYIAERYEVIYQTQQAKMFAEVMNDKNVKKYTKHRKSTDPKFEFNPNSPYHLRDLYYKYYKIPANDKTETGLPTTSAKALKPFTKDYPIIETIRMYKLLGKMLSTYIGPAGSSWIRGDGLVSSTYNINGAVTGRLSSSEPNLQNIPTPEKEPGTLLAYLPVKNLFTHSYWDRSTFPPKSQGVLMSVDYSGMELRVFASLAACDAMIDIHKSGKDFHTMVSTMVSGIPYEKVDKATRYVYKWTNWTLLYGGDERTLVRLYGIPEVDAVRTIKLYYQQFPEVLDYRNQTTEFAEEHGYIESPYGRREQLHYINDNNRLNIGKRNKDRRSAVNMPVQSSASDTLLFAAIVISHQLEVMGLEARIVNTVHDSIVLSVPYHEIDVVAGLCTTVMENVTSYAGEYFPNVDFSWLICPLVADVDIGNNYGVLTDYKKWVASGRKEL